MVSLSGDEDPLRKPASPELLEEGIRAISEQLNRDPGNLEARVTRAAFRLMLAKLREGAARMTLARGAEEDYTVLLEADPAHIDARARRAHARLLLGSDETRAAAAVTLLDDALEDINEAIRLRPDEDSFTLRAVLQCRRLEHLGDTPEGLDALRQSCADFEQADRLKPGDPDTIFGLAGARDLLVFGIKRPCLAGADEAQSMVDLWMRGRNLAGGEAPHIQGRLARAHLMLAVAHSQAGEDCTPSLFTALLELQVGQFHDPIAVNVLERAEFVLDHMSPGPKAPVTLLKGVASEVRARFLEQQGKSARAAWRTSRALMEQALQEDPTYTLSHFMLTRLHIHRRDWKAAHAALDLYRAAEPQDPGLAAMERSLREQERAGG